MNTSYGFKKIEIGKEMTNLFHKKKKIIIINKVKEKKKKRKI